MESVMTFEDACLHLVVLANIKLAGYHIPTTVQKYALVAVFKGHDFVACAQTGSGKIAAFLIPILIGKAKKLATPRPNPVAYQPGVLC